MAEELDDDDAEEQRHLSLPRVCIALLAVVAILAGGAFVVRREMNAKGSGTLTATWFAPYVDATLTPTFQFQEPSQSPSRQVVLGFVVDQPHQACTPSWGSAYTMDQAGQSLNLDRRVAQVRANGGMPIVSFGGEANTELAVSCANESQLEAAYKSVIDRYQLTTVDFDIEGNVALGDTAAIQRRAEALAALQKSTRAAGHQLAIWLTLPVEPDGLQADASAVVSTMIRDGVDLAGVNVMTMDFGGPETDMAKPVQDALTATHNDLSTIYRQFGIGLTSTDVWNRIGATVMIGQNDTNGEIYTIADANQLLSFATSHHLGRISMWSLNRDSQCGSEFAQTGVHSNTCSGTPQSPFGFSKVFSKLTGTAEALNSVETPKPYIPNPNDNPATSPYPIWQPGASYVAGYKVVREGYVYQAKWYTQGADPAQQTEDAYQTPWELIGPVLPGDHAPTVTTLPAGAYPDWSSTTAYVGGQQVLRDGLPYRAKYYTKGDDPLAAANGASSSPWTPEYTVPGEPAPAATAG